MLRPSSTSDWSFSSASSIRRRILAAPSVSTVTRQSPAATPAATDGLHLLHTRAREDRRRSGRVRAGPHPRARVRGEWTPTHGVCRLCDEVLHVHLSLIHI